MEKKLSAWCKNAKIEMINRDLKTTTLAKELDMNRSYVSSILNGRVYSAPAVKKISDYLGIADSDTTTVWIQDECAGWRFTVLYAENESGERRV